MSELINFFVGNQFKTEFDEIEIIHWDDNKIIFWEDFFKDVNSLKDITIWLEEPLKEIFKFNAIHHVIDIRLWQTIQQELVISCLKKVETKKLLILQKRYEFPHLKLLLEIINEKGGSFTIKY